MLNYRRTKIIATLGPATDADDVLAQLVTHGVNGFRINFSHGDAATHQQRIHHARTCAQKAGRAIAILADLQGPKIRIAQFKNKCIHLSVGDRFILDGACALDAGDTTRVGIAYPSLPSEVTAGNELLLDDGRIVLRVASVHNQEIHTEVISGGPLSNNKGINLRGGGLSADALTEKDKADLITAVESEVDYIALSFVRHRDDVEQAKTLIEQAGSTAGVIAKIERREALEHLEAIIQASDGVMVARGDLGVEIGDPQLPSAQKRIVHLARALNKPVIIATQMMESMITNPCPTRAEVFDVANAVLTSTDAVMLSAESATGKHPVKVVDTMAGICLGAERSPETQVSRHRVECQFQRIDEAVAMATMYTANHLDIRAIVCLTESGFTPLLMSRIRTAIPIYALSRFASTCQRMALYLGVHPIHFDVSQFPLGEINGRAIEKLQQHQLLSDGDWVIMTRGDFMGVHGQTNDMKIVEVGHVI